MLPNPFFPEAVVQSNLSASSDLLIWNVCGILPLQEPLLFDSLHSPSLPSLKDNATGTLGSLTIVAQEVRTKIDVKIKLYFSSVNPIILFR